MNVPVCLTERPLVFGDREQIDAIKAVRRLEEEQDEAAEEGKQIYVVKFEYSGWHEVEVTAKDKAEARLMADEEPLDMDDVDLEFVTVTLKGGSK